MELYQLRSFVVVATELHFGRAAGRLLITQPTLSRQIAALEKDLGVPLFERYGRRIRLTPAGRIFLDRAEDLVRRADAAAHDAQRAAVGELGELRVGSVQSAIPEALPRLLTGFRIAAPDVRLSVTSMTTLNQVRALTDGELDLGLLRPQQPRAGIGDLRTRTISRDHWVAVLPADHRHARRRRIGLADLADEDFVLYGPEIGTTGHDQILDHCAAAGFAPRIVQQTTDAQTTVALVAAGLGVSLILSPTPPMAAGSGGLPSADRSASGLGAGDRLVGSQPFCDSAAIPCGAGRTLARMAGPGLWHDFESLVWFEAEIGPELVARLEIVPLGPGYSFAGRRIR